MSVYVRSLCAIALLATCVSGASAQLVFGTTTSVTDNACAMYLDVNTQDVTVLWNTASKKKVNGMAADPDSGRLYCNDAARLNYWNYQNVGTVPTLIGGMYRTTDGVSFSATGVDGLAFANGNLYGATSYPSTTFVRGIYQVATTTDAAGHCVMTPLWVDPTGVPGTSSGSLEFGGLEYNADNNLFYFTSDVDNADYTPGIFTVDAFGTGTLTKIAEFPVGHGQIDGMALGDGKLWLTEQDPTNSQINIFPYDLATQTYGTPLYVPLVDGTQRASGAAWAPGAIVPEPGTLGALALLTLAALRTRRSA